MIRLLLQEKFQLKLSLASVGRLLRQLGLTCQRPLFRAWSKIRKGCGDGWSRSIRPFVSRLVR